IDHVEEAVGKADRGDDLVGAAGVLDDRADGQHDQQRADDVGDDAIAQEGSLHHPVRYSLGLRSGLAASQARYLLYAASSGSSSTRSRTAGFSRTALIGGGRRSA